MASMAMSDASTQASTPMKASTPMAASAADGRMSIESNASSASLLPVPPSYLDGLRSLQIRAEQEVCVMKSLDQPDSTTWCLLDINWLKVWRAFTRGEGPPPGVIDNSALLDQHGQLRSSTPAVDYRGLTFGQCYYLMGIYGMRDETHIIRRLHLPIDRERIHCDPDFVHRKDNCSGSDGRCAVCLGRQTGRKMNRLSLDGGRMTVQCNKDAAVLSQEYRSEGLFLKFLDSKKLCQLQSFMTSRAEALSTLHHLPMELRAAVTRRQHDLELLATWTPSEPANSFESMEAFIGAAQRRSRVDSAAESLKITEMMSGMKRKLDALSTPARVDTLHNVVPVSMDDL